MKRAPTYDGTGRMTGTTDPLGHHTTIAVNPAGQVTSVTDPLSHRWQSGYTDGDLTSVTKPSRKAVDTIVVDHIDRPTAN